MRLKAKHIRLTPETRLHALAVPLVGLSGSIACGKSTVAALLEQCNIAIISADSLIKALYGQEETRDFIGRLAPECQRQGSIDFNLLRSKTFGDKALRKSLENFLHPRLAGVFSAKFKELGRPATVVYDIPLLFEKSLEGSVDLSVCVHCSREEQIRRLTLRDGIKRPLALAMLESQLDMATKKSRADTLIDNNLGQAELAAEVKAFVCKYFG